MNRRLQLLNRRRDNVLLSRHVRAVSLRHVPHQCVVVSKTKKAVEINNEEVVSVVEPIVEKVEQKEEPKKEVVKKVKKTVSAEEKKQQKSKEKQKKQAKKAKKKAQKIQDKEDALERLIDEPTTSLWLILSNPILCIERLGTVDYATLSSAQRTLLNIIKWIAFSACFGVLISNFINVNPFGFARLNFSATALLTAKIAVFAFFAELFIVYLIYLLCNSKKCSVDKGRMVSISAIAAPAKIILFVVSAIVINVNSAIGMALFLASTVISIMLSAFALSKTELPPRRCMLAIGVGLFISLVLFGFYFSYVAKDVIKIFYNIMNI